MKYLALLFVFTSFFQSDNGSVNWVQTYQDGEFRSKKENKLMMLYFWSPTNESCRRMDIETMSRESIISATRGFISIQVDYRNEVDIAGRYGVQAIPQIVVVDSYGVIIDRLKGIRRNSKLEPRQSSAIQPEVLEAITTAKLERFLSKYPSNIALINSAQEVLSKDNYDIPALFDVTEAYLLTATNATASGTTNFIAEANTYLGKTKKLLKKKKSKALQQRFDILTIAKEVYRKDPTKGVKKMIAFSKANEIFPQNAAFIHTSLYLAYTTMGQKRKAEAELELLKSAKNPNHYINFIMTKAL